MSTVYGPIGHYVNVTGIAECITERLAETPAGIPNRVCIYPGDVAWDACECGMLALTTTRILPSSSFPPGGPEVIIDCGIPYLVATVDITILRCIPPGTETRPPTCAQLGAAAQIQYTDAFAVWQGALCCLRTMRDAGFVQEFSMGVQTFTGPQGMCGGSTLTIDLGYTGACCD